MNIKQLIKDIYPLSSLQQGILFHSLLSEKEELYVTQILLEICGPLDIQRFEDSFNNLVERHDIFRTAVVYENVKLPLQAVLKERKLNIHFTDLTNQSVEAQEAYIEEFRKADRAKGFQLNKPPLVRIIAFRVETERHLILWSTHHIIIDGWSTDLILSELEEIYQALTSGQVPKLEEPAPFSNYFKWLAKQEREQAVHYWKEYLAGYDEPVGLPKLPILSHETKHLERDIRFTLSKEISSSLTEIATKYQVTLNTVYQVVWGILLQKYNDTPDVVFGTVVTVRPSDIPNVEKIVGLLINTIPVRIQNDSKTSFSQIIVNIQTAANESSRYSFFSLAEIQTNTPLKQQLFDNLMAFQNYATQENKKSEGIHLQKVKNYEEANYDFTFIVSPAEENQIILSYNANLYPVELINGVKEDLLEIFATVTANPDIPIGEIHLSSVVEEPEVVKIEAEFDF